MSNSKKYQISALVCLALAAAFLIVFFTSLLSCGAGSPAEKPEATLERFTVAVNEGRYEEAQKMISANSTVIFGDNQQSETLDAIFETVYSRFSVSPEKTVILGGKAGVTARVMFFDMRVFANDVYKLVQQRAYEQSYEGNSISSEKEANELVSKVELELLAGDTTKYITTETVEIQLVSENGEWKIVADDAFYNLLSGYASQIEIEKEVSAENE